MGGLESTRISRVGQTVVARLIESQIGHQPASSVALCRESLGKGQWPLPTFLSGRKLSPNSSLDARHQFLPVCQCWSSEGVSLINSVCGFFKGNCLGFQKFLPLTQSLLVFAARSYGDLSSWYWNPGLGGQVWGWASLFPIYLSQIFIHQMYLFHISTPFTSLDGRGFFNSVVVRLPFNSISDCSE